MLQRYKLRLGDGTVLLVDHDGLGTWLVDGKASVQAGKSRNWIPLRKFLASERAAAARRARSEAAAWASLPADSPGARRGDGLPLVPPPPPRGETPAPDARAPRADGLPLVPPPGSPEEASPPSLTPPPREDGLPLVPPPPPRDAAPPVVAVPLFGKDELSLVLPPPLQDPPSLPSTPPDAPDSSGAALASASEERSAGLPGIGGEPALPAVELLEEEAPASDAPAPSEDEAIARITVGEPRVVQVATEEAIWADGRPPGGTLPEEPSPAGAEEASSAPERPLPLAGPGGMDSAMRGGVDEPHEIQALAEEPLSPEVAPGPVAHLPVIPLKALEGDEPFRPTPLLAGTSETFHGSGEGDPRRSNDDRGDPVDRPRSPMAPFDRGGPFSEKLEQLGRAVAAHRAVVSLGAFLSRCLDPINRLERGMPLFPVAVAGEGGLERRTPRGGAAVAAPPPSGEVGQIRPLAEEPSLAPERHSAFASNDGAPLIPLKPLEEDETPLWDPARGRRLLARVRSWADKPATWIAGLAEGDRPGLPGEPEAPHALEPAPRAALQAPPAINDLPVLRFATAHEEPAVEEDVYGGDETEALLPSMWVWAKRLALAAALIAGATLAALTFETWSPKAAKIGETALSEIDGRVRSHHLAGQRQKAVAEVEAALPQLEPETIGRVMAASPTGLLDAAGVFELACDATDRGASALPAGDARELEVLQQRLLGALLPAERERLREFDLARVRGAVFPLDSRQALTAYARGARQLSTASLERLRLLLGQAITAGLARPSQARTGGAAGR